jgi:hypothetical protein
MDLICEHRAEGDARARVASSFTAVECASWLCVAQRLRQVNPALSPLI